MFLAFLLAKAAAIVNTRQHKFKDLGELESWAAQERYNTEVKPSHEVASA